VLGAAANGVVARAKASGRAKGGAKTGGSGSAKGVARRGSGSAPSFRRRTSNATGATASSAAQSAAARGNNSRAGTEGRGGSGGGSRGSTPRGEHSSARTAAGAGAAAASAIAPRQVAVTAKQQFLFQGVNSTAASHANSMGAGVAAVGGAMAIRGISSGAVSRSREPSPREHLQPQQPQPGFRNQQQMRAHQPRQLAKGRVTHREAAGTAASSSSSSSAPTDHASRTSDNTFHALGLPSLGQSPPPTGSITFSEKAGQAAQARKDGRLPRPSAAQQQQQQQKHAPTQRSVQYAQYERMATGAVGAAGTGGASAHGVASRKPPPAYSEIAVGGQHLPGTHS
jgi:hypothetical protein